MPDTLFSFYKIDDIVGIIVERQMKILYKKSFPVGSKSHHKILELLQSN